MLSTGEVVCRMSVAGAHIIVKKGGSHVTHICMCNSSASSACFCTPPGMMKNVGQHSSTAARTEERKFSVILLNVCGIFSPALTAFHSSNYRTISIVWSWHVSSEKVDRFCTDLIICVHSKYTASVESFNQKYVSPYFSMRWAGCALTDERDESTEKEKKVFNEEWRADDG